MKKYLNQPLTARGAITVILITCALAAGGYASYKFSTAKILEFRVKKALPEVCEGIRKQQEIISKAIENYKLAFGIYPPDNITNRSPLKVDPVNNPLFYELAGAVYNPTNKRFEFGGVEAAEASFVKNFFHATNFINSGDSTNSVKQFLSREDWGLKQLHDDPDVYALSYQIPWNDAHPDLVWEFEISPWRYVSSMPTHNPGKYDLWIEVKTSTQTVTLGNW